MSQFQGFGGFIGKYEDISFFNSMNACMELVGFSASDQVKNPCFRWNDAKYVNLVGLK